MVSITESNCNPKDFVHIDDVEQRGSSSREPAQEYTNDGQSSLDGAARKLHVLQQSTTIERAAPSRWLSIEQLMDTPPLDWLIEPVMTVGGMVELFANYGAGKSFVTLDMALCVAAGLRWHGHNVKSGAVAYIVAEGAQGFTLRVPAWLEAHNLTAADLTGKIHFLPQKEDIPNRKAVERMIAELEALPEPPSLVVIDTAARALEGYDENSPKDMGAFISGCAQIRQATGATVLIVHHTGKSGDGDRGHSSLSAAMDTVMKLSRPGGRMLLQCTKQKDGAEPFTPIALNLTQVMDGKTCIVKDGNVPADTAGVAVKNRTDQRVLEALGSLGKATNGDIVRNTQLKKQTVDSSLKRLVAEGLVLKGEAHTYRLSEHVRKVYEQTTSDDLIPSSEKTSEEPPF